MFDSRQVNMQSYVGFLGSVAVILTAIGAFGPTGSGSGYWSGDRLYGGWVEVCKSDMDLSCSTMTAAAAVAVLAFLFTLMGCITCFTPNYDNRQHARIRLLAFVLGAFWAVLSLILYPAANLDDYPFVENVAWPCDFVAFWLLGLLSALLRTHAKKSREPPPSWPIPQLSLSAPHPESVEMAVMPVSLLPNEPLGRALALASTPFFADQLPQFLSNETAEHAFRLWEEGNQLFRHGNAEGAVGKYLEAACLLGDTSKPTFTHDMKRKADECRVKCMANIGSVSLKLRHFDDAVEWHTKAISLMENGALSGDVSKQKQLCILSYFCRARARIRLGQLKLALVCASPYIASVAGSAHATGHAILGFCLQDDLQHVLLIQPDHLEVIPMELL